MKISNEQLLPIQTEELQKNRANSPQGFDALLSEQLKSGQPQGSASAFGVNSLIQGALPVSILEEAGLSSGQAASLAGEMSARMDGLFNGMDDYAKQLASNDPSALRNAYALLESMTSEIASFKEAYPDMENGQPELAAMVNELEVLTVTERFKFNRGDYL